MSDDEFLASFENGGQSIESCHHADHVRVAFLFLRKFPAIEALDRFVRSLKTFAIHKGQPGLYHETITWAFVFLINERMSRGSADQSWTDFAAANPDLLDWENNILRKYYRPETLRSPLARSTFLFPDNIT